MIENIIRRARRRLIVNEALMQLAFAGSIALAGLALVLTLGTRYLEWWTLALFAGAGIVAGIFRVYRATPDAYATAVRLDQNAGLSDALSTALYFSTLTSAFPSARTPFQRAQREQAEALAGRIDLDGAFPFTFPRALYAMAALTLLASGLVVLRYRVARGLDLRPPLNEILFEDLAAKQPPKPVDQAREIARRKRLEAAESLLTKLGVPLNPDERQDQAALDKAIDQALEAPASAGKGKKGDAGGKGDDTKTGNGLEQSPNGDPLDGKSPDTGDKTQEGKTPGTQGAAGDKGASKSSSGGDNSSLLSKLKDAVSNMFSKATEDKGAQGQKSQPQQQGQSAKADKGNGEKGSAGKGQEQGQTDADAQEGEPNGDAQAGQQAQGKSTSKSAQQSSQAGSGVGSQDGAKDLRAAEQMKAMGKISEIIGKRAATVSGETTIEVQSGNQQLRTAYSNRAAAHNEADSDVSRDEIPVALQPYIQQYFEQVRKTAGPKSVSTQPVPPGRSASKN